MKRVLILTAVLLALLSVLCVNACACEEDNFPVPVWQFCHGLGKGLDTAVITAYTTDCETGLVPAEITHEEADWIRGLAMNGIITGKASDLCLTGGTWVYSFATPNGTHLLSIEVYQGMIATDDGMYSYRIEE